MNVANRLMLPLIVILSIWFLVYYDALVSMVNVWSSSETYKHCFFILPIVLYLIYERKDELKHLDYAPNFWAITALIASLGGDLAAQLLGINLFSHISAYTSLLAILWLCLGNDFIRQFRFPLFFLAFSIPFGDELVPALQDITAYITVALVQGVGIPIYREGLYLYVPNGTFLVAEACAGIRFLIASFALGTLFSYLNYKTRWKFFAFILASILVPIIANGIRAFGIVVIGYASDMKYATGADHLVYGWFFFAFVLLLLFFIGQLGQEDTSVKVDTAHTSSIRVMRLPHLLLCIVAASVIPFYANYLVFAPVSHTPATLQQALNEHSAKSAALDWQPALHAPQQQWSGYLFGYATYIAQYDVDNQQHELVSGLNRYYDIDMYTRKQIQRVDIPGGNANLVDLVDVKGQSIQLLYWFSVDGKRTAGAVSTKLNQALSKLAGRSGKGRFYAVQLPPDSNPTSAVQALAVLD